MTSRRKQQLGGLLLLVAGCGVTAWTWQAALARGFYGVKAGVFFPAVGVLGLGLLLFPGYREERLGRGEDLSRLSGLQLLTARWWVILALGLLAGLGNYLLLAAYVGN